jgi:predicted enzyme related to lactoylglutathione lyase
MRASIDRIIFNLVATDVEAIAQFYCELVGFKRHFESDWYIILVPEKGPMIELGIISSSSQVTPKQSVGGTGGSYLTLVVDDVDAAHQRAISLGAEIIEPPTALEYGQTRMLVRDPDGMIVDVSALTR